MFLDDEEVAANAPTPPYVNSIKDTLNSSMNFGDEENPWISWGYFTYYLPSELPIEIATVVYNPLFQLPYIPFIKNTRFIKVKEQVR